MVSAGSLSPEPLPVAPALAVHEAFDHNDFLAMAVHELRGPVTVLTGCADTLAELWGTAALEVHGPVILDAMVSVAHRLRSLVNDLLTDAYLNHGEPALDVQLCPLLPIVRLAVSTSGVDPLAVTVLADPHVIVSTDADRLEQILVNLITNAVQHGGDDPRVVVGVTDAGANVELSVTDSGPGISAADSVHLFEPFSALAAHDSDSTGLGLVIARNLARALGGDLHYAPLPVGARFVLRLPVG